jgi:dihydroxyacid dehydratase/phosphogluconate dehydratase
MDSFGSVSVESMPGPRQVCEAVEAAGGKPVIFGTPIVTDGEAQGMKQGETDRGSRGLT